MKAIYNNHKQATHEEENSEGLLKRFMEIQNSNKEKESIIAKIEKEVSMLEEQSANLEEQLTAHERQLKEINDKVQEEKSQEEDQEEMNNWIENVQKYSGIPQEMIDSLCSLEYEGEEHEICLSCYQQLNLGTMCTYLPCSHLFHKDCISNHLKVNKTCPACQEVVQL